MFTWEILGKLMEVFSWPPSFLSFPLECGVCTTEMCVNGTTRPKVFSGVTLCSTTLKPVFCSPRDLLILGQGVSGPPSLVFQRRSQLKNWKEICPDIKTPLTLSVSTFHRHLHTWLPPMSCESNGKKGSCHCSQGPTAPGIKSVANKHLLGQ